MSDKVEDGGPAFPLVTPNDWSERAHGMTLRDWFAGRALVGACSAPFSEGAAPEMARACYAMADAMLAARTKVQP
jgi:hypothetical protein